MQLAIGVDHLPEHFHELDPFLRTERGLDDPGEAVKLTRLRDPGLGGIDQAVALLGPEFETLGDQAI